MKKYNRWLVGLLLMIAGFVWSNVFLSLTDSVTDSNDNKNMLSRIQPSLDSIDNNPELKLNYHDPFYGKPGSSSKPITSAVIKKKMILSRKTDPVQHFVVWPDVQYKGMLINHSSNKTLAILTIGQKEVIYAEGTEIEGFRLEKITKDSILIMKENQSRIYVKNS